MRIRDSRDEPYFPGKVKLLSCRIQMNTLFKDNYGRKRRKYDRNIYNVMKIPVNVFQTNKSCFFAVQPKNACNLVFTYHLCLPFIDPPQSEILVFAIITFQINKILVHKWKHVIGPNDILSFNEKLDINSTSII